MTTQERVWKVGALVGILLVVFLVAISIKEFKSIAYVGVNPTSTNQITVDGTGDAVAIPDVATFSFSVTETAATVADAQSKATNKNNAAITAVKTAGIADKDIQTLSYNINPHYEYQNSICQANGICPPSKSVLTGYDVSQTTQIKIRDFTKIGSILTTIGTLGVQNVNGVTFSVDKPESVQAQARATAIANAQSKAQTLAGQLGVRLVRVVSFSESGANIPRPMMYDLAAGVSSSKTAAAPEISTGEQKISSTVSITYQIE